MCDILFSISCFNELAAYILIVRLLFQKVFNETAILFIRQLLVIIQIICTLLFLLRMRSNAHDYMYSDFMSYYSPSMYSHHGVYLHYVYINIIHLVRIHTIRIQ
jgi:hypothetical protein